MSVYVSLCCLEPLTTNSILCCLISFNVIVMMASESSSSDIRRDSGLR